MEDLRQLIGKRARGVGKLRPSVVLYNELHKDGEGVGEVVRKDLIGGSKGKGRGGADLLLVVGTSLRVPGTKRIVREFAKAVRSRASGPSTKDSSGSGLLTPSPSPRRSPTTDVEPPTTSVYLNFDFPVPTREWEGVFDVWLQGDAQNFAEMLQEEIQKETKAREFASEKKRKRAEEAVSAERISLQKGKKRGVSSSPTKRRKIDLSRSKGKSIPKSKATTVRSKPSRSNIIIRIPARPKPPTSPTRKFFVPEVYLSTPPPSARKVMSPAAPSTPARPVRSCRDKPLAAKTGVAHPETVTTRRQFEDCHSPHHPTCITPDPGDESSELSDVPDELPSSYFYGD